MKPTIFLELAAGISIQLMFASNSILKNAATPVVYVDFDLTDFLPKCDGQRWRRKMTKSTSPAFYAAKKINLLPSGE